MKEKRGSWGSNFGFLMAAIGSAVGLGNIWAFPYKMGQGGGFAFLLVYLILAILVGFPVILGELTMGRKSGRGPVGAYRKLSRKFREAGWLCILASFLFTSFYCVLGGWCVKYLVLNFGNLIGAVFGSGNCSGEEIFWSLVNSPGVSIFYTLVYIVITGAIVLCGVSGGIERFSKLAVPGLVVMLLIMIVKCLALPGAMEGVQFMVSPDFTPLKENFFGVLASAGGQVFFSLSLGMGSMIAYGSYLSKKEDLEKNTAVIVAADTIIALLAGLCVIPAAFALGGRSAELAGPELLFVTLQNVFTQMGSAGNWFGFLFYFLVVIAAVTSSIALVEMMAAFLREDMCPGHGIGRGTSTLLVSGASALPACFIAADAMGTGRLGNIAWLNLISRCAEGIAMPVSALLMVLFLGYEYGEKRFAEEVTLNGRAFRSRCIFGFCCRVIVPIVMLMVLLGQMGLFQ